MIARAYTYIRWLSLDIVAGAIFVSAFLSREVGITLTTVESALLGLAVWSVYTIDHLRDSATRHLTTERRKFHFRNRRLLKVLLGISIGLAVILLFFISKAVLYSGMCLAAVVVGYLVFVPRLKGMKECTGALLYSAGILLVPFVRGEPSATLPIAGLLFLLAFLNLLIYAVLEQAEDAREGFHSFVHQFGERPAGVVIWITAILSLVGSVVLYYFNYSFVLVLFFMIAPFVHVLLFHVSWFHTKERYRILGDLIFLLPGFLLLLERV
jgi:4-hydroxybenzoate polyprenyltransferase